MTELLLALLFTFTPQDLARPVNVNICTILQRQIFPGYLIGNWPSHYVPPGQTVNVCGWVAGIQTSGGECFVEIYDSSIRRTPWLKNGGAITFTLDPCIFEGDPTVKFDLARPICIQTVMPVDQKAPVWTYPVRSVYQPAPEKLPFWLRNGKGK